MDIVKAAQEIATIAHEGVKRKYNHRPYIEHPQQVAERIATWQYEMSKERRDIMHAAALCHDVLEDRPDKAEEFAAQICDACGPQVLRLVRELTNPSKDHKHLNRAARKQMDREHLAEVSWEAKILKMMDRICNLRDTFPCGDLKYIRLYVEESLALVAILEDADPVLGEELRFIANDLLKSAESVLQ